VTTGPSDPRDALLRLTVGEVAHGGHCVARHEGRVVFVRHALPGEEVLARPVQAGPSDRYWRADAVRVLEPSDDRVDPPCPLARPGGCGGCDWQHASLPAQRRLKARVIREHLARSAGLDLPDLTVEPVPGDDAGLGWRTRLRFCVDGSGRAGLHPYRSHAVVPVPDCPIAHPDLSQLRIGQRHWSGVSVVEAVVAGAGALSSQTPVPTERLVVLEPRAPSGRVSTPPLPDGTSVALLTPEGLRRVRGRTWVSERVLLDGAPRALRVTGAGFWQVHPGAAQLLLGEVLRVTAPRAGEHALDLYSGGGLFATGLAAAVGPDGAVTAVESDRRAVSDARRNLHGTGWVSLETGRVERVLPRLAAHRGLRADVVVLDPPRVGAGRAVVEQLLALRPRAVAYVSCDPASLARDLGYARSAGYRVSGLRAFDAFPMTHHLECVAVLEPAQGQDRPVDLPS
jgi:tRNA/tmRNA/rRNA uracil-C5-methylase (TrmA/RlmC/RlmD family)